MNKFYELQIASKYRIRQEKSKEKAELVLRWVGGIQGARTMNREEKNRTVGAPHLERLVRWLKQRVCWHEFYTEDLCAGYEKPKMPEGLTVEQEYEHDAFKKRVRWACAKCGREFYAHTGLDIVGGPKMKWKAYRRPSNIKLTGGLTAESEKINEWPE